MTDKRYFKRIWEEEYYIFDSQTISENEFDEKVEYEDYQAFADSMMGDEVVNKLNQLNDKNEQLKHRLAISEKANFVTALEKEYHNAFDCSQCRYHNYDWFDDGDEFEVCDKKNDEAQMDNHSCTEWEEL